MNDEISAVNMERNFRDILHLDETYTSENKEKKHYYGKKRYKNAKTIANVYITDAILEKMIRDNFSGQEFPRYIKFFKNNYKECLDTSTKNSQKSIDARIKANEMFTKPEHSAQIHKDIWELYCKSIAFAPVRSKELVLAYECRSNLLLHFKKYDDCVRDIDRAFAITEFDALRVKLLCRKMTCFAAMNKEISDKLDLLKTLDYHLEKVDFAFKDEKFLKLVEKAKNETKIQPVKKENVSESLNSSTHSINDIELIMNKEVRIVAKRDYEPGDLVVITKPHTASFNPSKFYAYCSHCISFMWAGIPCDECSLCMYCSEECRKKAWNTYHKLECKILPHINIQDIAYNIMHLSTRVFLKGLKEFGSISKIKEKMQEVDKLRDESKVQQNLFISEFLQFYASSYTRIKSSEYNLNAVSKVIMKACFLTYYMVQTCEIFDKTELKLMRGKELAKKQDVVDLGFIMTKLLITNNRFIKAAGQAYTTLSKCDKYEEKSKCNTNRHCIRGSYYDIFYAMFEKSCSPNVARCWTDNGTLIYYCIQPIKKMEKITMYSYDQFFKFPKATRDTGAYFSIYCDCVACSKNWPTMEELFAKTKQRLLKRETRQTEIMQKYLERNQSKTNFVQEKNCVFTEEEYQQLLKDVNDVVKICGQPSFASSLMIEYLLFAFEKRYGTIPLISQIPTKCGNVL